MPNILVALDDVESSVERPVIFDVLREVMEITRISSQTPIRFMGEDGKAAQTNSTLTKNPLSENSFAFNDRVTIDVEDEFERDRILSTTVKGAEHAPIFLDEDLGIYVRPVYAPCTVTIRAKYRSRDRNQAKRWRNSILMATAMLRDVNMHEVGYHYHLPEACLVLLCELHRLRELQGGFGESFNEYFTRRLTTNASIMTNLSGSSSLWGISERQIRVQGYFEFEAVPDKPEKDGEGDAWTVGFSYKFNYDKPVQCNMAYPIMVHNSLLSEEYRPGEPAYSLQDQRRSYSASTRAFNEFETDTQLLLTQGNGGLDIPAFDEFSPNSILPATVRVCTVLSSITSDERVSLFDLDELGDFNLDLDVLEFIRQSEYPFMGKNYQSILCLSLYEGQFLRASSTLSVNASLGVSATAPLDLRTTHRVRMSLVVDFSYLTREALERLKAYPAAAGKIAKAIDAALSDLGGQPDIGKNHLSPSDYMLIGLDPKGSYAPWRPNVRDTLPLGPSGRYDPSGNVWGLVQTLFVATRPAHLYEHDRDSQTYGRTL